MVQVLEAHLDALHPTLLLEHIIDEVEDCLRVEDLDFRLEFTAVHQVRILEVTH